MPCTPWATCAPWPGWWIGSVGSIGGDQGWFYDLLRKAGVSAATAHSLVEFVLRPLEVVLIGVGAWLVARYGARVLRRAVVRMGSSAASLSSSPRTRSRVSTHAAILANLWRFAVAVLAVATVLGMLGINLTPLLASATVIGATIGFGAQALVRDYLSGFLLTVEDQYVIGDTIAVNGVTGTVEDLSLRVTRVRAMDGSLVYVPNGDIRQLTNRSRGWAKAVVDVEVPIGSAADLARATELVGEAARAVVRRAPPAAGCTQEPEVLGLVATSGASGTLRVMVRANHGHRATIERELRAAVVGALADAHLWPGTEPSG
jgi:small-conductance mechanosensitive channel